MSIIFKILVRMATIILVVMAGCAGRRQFPIDPMEQPPPLYNQRYSVDEQQCFRYQAVAIVTAPPEKVYDSLVNPLRPAKTTSFSQCVLIDVKESADHRTQIKDFGFAGPQTLWRTKVTSDPEHLTMTEETLLPATLLMRSTYRVENLSRARSGVFYSYRDCSPPPDPAKLHIPDGVILSLTPEQRARAAAFIFKGTVRSIDTDLQ